MLDDLSVDSFQTELHEGTYFRIFKVMLSQGGIQISAGTQLKIVVDEDQLPRGEYLYKVSAEFLDVVEAVEPEDMTYIIHSCNDLLLSFTVKRNCNLDEISLLIFKSYRVY